MALTTISVAMLVAAPAVFDDDGWPVRSDSHWPIRRAMMSLPPAGAKPTTQRTGRDGQPCAAASLGRRGAWRHPSRHCPRGAACLGEAVSWRPSSCGNCRQTPKQRRETQVHALYRRAAGDEKAWRVTVGERQQTMSRVKKRRCVRHHLRSTSKMSYKTLLQFTFPYAPFI